MGLVLEVAENGRLDLPSQMRRMIGLEGGGPVSVWVENGEIRVRAVREVMAELQSEAAQLFSGGGDSVERFLEDRRAEAEAEGEADAP